jgi:hypothetical protein
VNAEPTALPAVIYSQEMTPWDGKQYLDGTCVAAEVYEPLDLETASR